MLLTICKTFSGVCGVCSNSIIKLAMHPVCSHVTNIHTIRLIHEVQMLFTVSIKLILRAIRATTDAYRPLDKEDIFKESKIKTEGFHILFIDP